MSPSPNSSELREFLLDRLPPEQAEAIEARMFQDEAYFSDMQDAEDELIEEYVTESLDPNDARLFAARLDQDPKMQERVAIRRALIRTLQGSAAEAAVVAAAPARRAMWGRFLVPGFALAILILFFVSWQAMHRKQMPSLATGTPVPGQGVTGNRQEAMAQAAAVLFLPAHVARGASQQTSVLHLGTAALVKLELETPTADASARWDVRVNSGGENVFSVSGLAARQAGVVSYVVAQVPASQLPPKSYEITLTPQSSAGGAVPSSWELQVLK